MDSINRFAPSVVRVHLCNLIFVNVVFTFKASPKWNPLRYEKAALFDNYNSSI
jgi:hypothetical protein